MTETSWKNPDVFSAELHFALLSQGLRGPLLRRLMRVARSDAELSRILEAKVSEFRRYVRESRQPTVWNLPLRAWEWLSDQARFTPPREVLMTLVYVVLALMGVEFFKSHVFFSPSEDALQAAAIPLRMGEPPAYHGPAKQQPLRLDEQMIDEFRRATKSEAWREALAAQLAASLTAVDVEPLLRKKLETVLASPEFADRLVSGPGQQPSPLQTDANPVAPTKQPAEGDIP